MLSSAGGSGGVAVNGCAGKGIQLATTFDSQLVCERCIMSALQRGARSYQVEPSSQLSKLIRVNDASERGSDEILELCNLRSRAEGKFSLVCLLLPGNV